MMRHIAVIDIGKTNAKVTLFDLQERCEGEVFSTANDIVPSPPYPHHDLEKLWSFILDSLGRIRRKSPVDAIAISAHGASIVGIDRSGNLPLPMLDYEFRELESVSDDYGHIRPPFSETGSPHLAAGLNVGTQLFWLQRNFPEEFAHIETLLTYPQYWSFRLTGVRSVEKTSLGAHGDLWNPYRGEFSSLVERMQWQRLMPPISTAFDRLGTILPEIAARTGLDPSTVVFSGLHDSNASLLTHLKSQSAPFSVVSTGTWVICFSVGGRKIDLDESRDTLVNVNAFGDPVPSARFMGGRAFQLSKADAQAGILAADRDMVLEEGIMLLPSLPDDSGPFPNRKSAWRGKLETLTPGGHLYAVSLYLGMMTGTSLELIGADGPLIVEGPFSRNRTFLEALAVMTGREVLTGGAGLTGTSAGAAAVALGRDAMLDKSTRVADIDPDPRMADYIALWRDLSRR